MSNCSTKKVQVEALKNKTLEIRCGKLTNRMQFFYLTGRDHDAASPTPKDSFKEEVLSSTWNLILESSFPPGMTLTIQPDFRIKIQSWKLCKIGNILLCLVFILLLIISVFIIILSVRKSVHPVSIYNFRIGTVIK